MLAPLAAGTVVRADGIGGRWMNTEMGLGGVAHRTARATFEQPYTLPTYVVDALIQYNGVARRMCAREPYDCTREGLTLGNDPDAMALLAHCLEWGMLRHVRRGRTWARGYGGGGIVMLVDDGRKSYEPLDETNIRRVLGARVLNRWELTPTVLDLDRNSPRAGEPEVYQVTIGGVRTMYAHHTRVIKMQGFDLPDQVLVRQLGWGGSVFDLAWAELRNWQVTNDLLPEMASRMSQGVYKQRYLEGGVSRDLKQQIVERFEAIQAGMSVLGDISIDPQESYEILARPMSGIGEIGELLGVAFVAAGDMPEVLVFGKSPGGLHASALSPEVTAWYDNCSGQQPEHYTPPVKRILRIHALAHEGPTQGRVPDFSALKWNPLYQESQQEKDASALSNAQRRQVDITSGVISVEEARTDPTLRVHYTLSLETAPASTAVEPLDGEEPLDDEAELAAGAAVSADASQIPVGESLVPVMHAARRLGYKSGAPLVRMAVAGRFPIWRVNGRWKVAQSLVDAAMTPHVFGDQTAIDSARAVH